MSPLVTDTGIDLHPDVTRVVTRLFVAGREDVGPGDSRATPVLRRVLDLDEEAVKAAVRDLDDRFGTRHRNLHATFLEHAAMVTDRAEGTTDMSEDRCLLLGATFTHEYAIEGAALCNPSAVPFPNATDDPHTTGVMPFVMSVRGVGEGHRSSIGFRSGTVTSDGLVTLDPADPFPVL
ncbi:MAG: glycosidase, partial [Actinomycetota bacterium]|nr:glycosidase [Actinomycetota bacterium]